MEEIGIDDMFWVNLDIGNSRIQLYQRQENTMFYLQYSEKDESLRLGKESKWLDIEFQTSERTMTENLEFRIFISDDKFINFDSSDDENGFCVKENNAQNKKNSLFHLKIMVRHDIDSPGRNQLTAV